MSRLQPTRYDGGEDGSTTEAVAIPEHEAASSQLRTAIYCRAKVVKVRGPEGFWELQHYLQTGGMLSVISALEVRFY